MTRKKLAEKLKSIGKSVFVNCFDIFSEYAKGDISQKNAIKGIQALHPGKSDSGCKVCCGNAKLIFKAKEECTGLHIIINSDRIEPNIVCEARKIIAKHCPLNTKNLIQQEKI